MRVIDNDCPDHITELEIDVEEFLSREFASGIYLVLKEFLLENIWIQLQESLKQSKIRGGLLI